MIPIHIPDHRLDDDDYIILVISLMVYPEHPELVYQGPSHE